MQALFPYDSVRPVQKEMMDDVEHALYNKKNLIAHAPTGLGKTASTLSIAVPFALENDLTLFFLTNRHTQHHIAVETLKEMKKKHGSSFVVADLIGKKWMCLQENVQKWHNSEFMEFCKALRETNKCTFYSQLYKQNSHELSVRAFKAQLDVKMQSALHVEQVKNVCNEHGICPYYFTSELAKEAHVIIADYYNVFHPAVQQTFFSKTGKELEKSILIVDEGHNVGDRIRTLVSATLSSIMIKSALKEAKNHGYEHATVWLQELQHVLNVLPHTKNIVECDDFMNPISRVIDYNRLIDEFEIISTELVEKKKRSFIGGIAEFLRKWKGGDEGFVRYLEEKNTPYGPATVLHYSCLDAALISQKIFDRVYASVVMSGTLTPTEMFRDMLGVSRSVEKVYDNPFPRENRKVLIIPETTTKFTLRNPVMYEQIARVCSSIMDAVPGNSAFFFPSYQLRDEVVKLVNGSRKLFVEKNHMGSSEKFAFLEEFKNCKDSGAALFGVAAANFSEGIDLPGDFLKAVIVVGLPLAKPDVQTRALIQYYDKKFKRGWDYGYTYPAMIRCLQAAGRCIRSEKDRGVIVFLDQRFIHPQYYKSIPPDWEAEVTRDYVEKVKHFFGVGWFEHDDKNARAGTSKP